MKHLLKLLSLAFSLCLAAAEPVFYMPLDDSADVVGKDGKKVAAGVVHGNAGYRSGVIGKALDVRRQAYDQVTAVTFHDMPAIDCTDGSVAFWFKPHWKENDPEQHRIIYARDPRFGGSRYNEGFRFYLIKLKNGMIELSVASPKQVQILKKDLFTEEWTHVAFSWEQKKSEIRLYINGKMVACQTVPDAFRKYDAPAKIDYFYGDEEIDRFKANVGDGLYDEVRIFDRVLSDSEIFTLASDGEKETFAACSLAPAGRSGGDIAFALRYREKRLAGPKKLLTLSGGDRTRKISFTAMGTSGRLSVIVENGGKTDTIETGCTLDLTEPHKIALEQNGNVLTFWLDDAVQGQMKLTKPFGKILTAESADGVALLAPSAVPSPEQLARLSDAAVRPAEKQLWELSDAERAASGIRNGFCLNGLWRVIPVNDCSYAPPAGDWGYMRVPGSFRSPLYRIYRENNGKLEPRNWQWKNKPLIEYRAGWYQRVFEVPPELRKEGRIYLNFTNLNGDVGRVCLNGKLIDEFRQDFKIFTVIPNARRLDVTDLLSRDGKNVLTLFIDRHYIELWRGQPCIGDHQEIALDDVWLENAPSKTALTAAVAMPSFRKKEITMRTRLQNPAGIRGKAEVRFDFRRAGTPGKSFAEDFDLNGETDQTVLFTRSWTDPVLWDSENPNLYDMSVTLTVDGKTADSLPARDFGFREA